jgi:hypothetical protein
VKRRARLRRRGEWLEWVAPPLRPAEIRVLRSFWRLKTWRPSDGPIDGISPERARSICDRLVAMRFLRALPNGLFLSPDSCTDTVDAMTTSNAIWLDSEDP